MTNRRDFLVALGVGAAELCIVEKVFATSFLPFSFNNGIVVHPRWFKRFHGKRSDSLFRNRKFRNFIEAQFPNVIAPFHSNRPMWDAVWSWMNRPGSITKHHNRYLVVDGTMAHFVPCRGMIWIDTKISSTAPLVMMAFMNVVGNKRELWLTSNLNLADMSPTDIPHHMTMSISRWLRESSNPISNEGGYLTRLVIYDSSVHKEIRSPAAYGVKRHRCEVNMASQVISNGVAL